MNEFYNTGKVLYTWRNLVNLKTFMSTAKSDYKEYFCKIKTWVTKYCLKCEHITGKIYTITDKFKHAHWYMYSYLGAIRISNFGCQDKIWIIKSWNEYMASKKRIQVFSRCENISTRILISINERNFLKVCYYLITTFATDCIITKYLDYLYCLKI